MLEFESDLNDQFEILTSEKQLVRVSDLQGASAINERFSNVDIYLYKRYDVENEYFSISDISAYCVNSATKKQVFDELFYYASVEYIARALNVYPSRLTKKDALDYIQDYDLPHASMFMRLFKSRFDVIAVRGASQGDYVEVIIPFYDNKALNEKQENELYDYFSKVFFNL